MRTKRSRQAGVKRSFNKDYRQRALPSDQRDIVRAVESLLSQRKGARSSGPKDTDVQNWIGEQRGW